MGVYIVLSNLTDEGRKTVMDNPDRIKEVNEEIEERGAKILDQYVLMGQYDFLTIIEAPDKETMTKIAMEMGSRGTVDTLTLPTIDVDELIKGVKE
ncbi:MAG: GYD domain-containing protein [Thermoplasmatota archaeon]